MSRSAYLQQRERMPTRSPFEEREGTERRPCPPPLIFFYSAGCGAVADQPFSRVNSETIIFTANADGAEMMAG